MLNWKKWMIRELIGKTAHTVRLRCDCGCEGRDMPFFHDRATYEKRGNDINEGRRFLLEQALTREKEHLLDVPDMKVSPGVNQLRKVKPLPLQQQKLWACSEQRNPEFYFLKKAQHEPTEWDQMVAEGDWNANEIVATTHKGEQVDRTMWVGMEYEHRKLDRPPDTSLTFQENAQIGCVKAENLQRFEDICRSRQNLHSLLPLFISSSESCGIMEELIDPSASEPNPDSLLFERSVLSRTGRDLLLSPHRRIHSWISIWAELVTLHA